MKLQPWIENPFHLISWLDMNKFSANQYFTLGDTMRLVQQVAEEFARKPDAKFNDSSVETAEKYLGQLKEKAAEVGLSVTVSLTEKALDVVNRQRDFKVLSRWVTIITEAMDSEMAQHLFFWMPPDRAKWHSKTGREILGDECVNRFSGSDIANEAEQAAKSFAAGLHTACAFHLMRITEAGVTALGNAIGYTWGTNPNWGAMFGYFDSQSKPKSTVRTGVWIQHGDFLDEVGGHFRAVKNAWRNDTMHLDKTYNEPQAAHLLAVIPSFMKQLAEKVDENGNFI